MKNTLVKCAAALICAFGVCVTGVLCSQKLANSVIEAAENRPAAAAVTPVSADTAADNTAEEVHTDGSAEAQYDVPVNAAPDAEETPAQADTAAEQEAAPAASSSSESKQTSSKPQTEAQVLAYFNTAVNKVKPGAKSLVKNYEKNTQAGTFSLTGPFKVFSSAINNLVKSNMGEKKEDHNRKITTKADIVKYFPVENESWSSKLAAENISSATLTEKGGKYVVTVRVKPDAASPDTAHGKGNHGKAFSIVMNRVILDNAGPVKSLLKDGLTIGYRDGRITAEIDPATGNITHINYYYVWILNVTAAGTSVSAPFGIEQDFNISW